VTQSNPSILVSGTLVVDEANSKFASDRGHAKIIIKSNRANFAEAIDELGSIAARNLAIGYAATHGVADPRLNGNVVGPYPLNREGVPLDKVADEHGEPLPPRHPKMQPASYAVEVPICRKLL